MLLAFTGVVVLTVTILMVRAVRVPVGEVTTQSDWIPISLALVATIGLVTGAVMIAAGLFF
jgi:hypothetical protein